MVETEIAETLRARCQVVFGTQAIDAPYITMPPDFAAMESIRDNTSGELLELKDEWSGSWYDTYNVSAQVNPQAPCSAYRLLQDCIEFLPHPYIPTPPDPSWQPQPVLDTLYGVYLFGACKYGAIYELDDERAAQMDAAFQQTVTRANLHKQQSDYSGAPMRAELQCIG